MMTEATPDPTKWETDMQPEIRSGTIVRVKFFDDIPDNLAVVFRRVRASKEGKRYTRAYIAGIGFGHETDLDNLEVREQTNTKTYEKRMAALGAYIDRRKAETKESRDD